MTNINHASQRSQTHENNHTHAYTHIHTYREGVRTPGHEYTLDRYVHTLTHANGHSPVREFKSTLKSASAFAYGVNTLYITYTTGPENTVTHTNQHTHMIAHTHTHTRTRTHSSSAMYKNSKDFGLQ